MNTSTRILLAFLAIGAFFFVDSGAQGAGKRGKQKVTVEAYVMSKCPFGVRALDELIPVVKALGNRVDLKIEYIGRVKDGEPHSMHGEDEVSGDILQLCARKTGTKKAWMKFLTCQNKNWRNIPKGWKKCVNSSGLKLKKMTQCYEGEQGKELLMKSFAVSDENKATGSPTIFIDSEKFKGRSKTDFGRAICAKLKGKPKYCAKIPKPAKVPITVLSDRRCNERGCDANRFLDFISNSLAGAQVTELDYSEPKAKALFEKSGAQYLPIVIFGPQLKKEEDVYRRLSRRLTAMPDSEDLYYPLGQKWDPRTEVCDDGRDNTGNGLVDCDDYSCAEKQICRVGIKRKLDIFLMSQCPYASKTMLAMEAVLDHFGKDHSKIDFEINFIGKVTNGSLTSMHGYSEVAEDKRQLCAQKYYANGYGYMTYVVCRYNDYKEPDWRLCVPEGMDAEEIERCSNGTEGEEMLRRSFLKSENLGKTGSPDWMIGNNKEMTGRTSEAIIKAFCDKNSDLKECTQASIKKLGKLADNQNSHVGNCQ